MNKRRRKKAYYKLLNGDTVTSRERLGAYRYARHVPFGSICLCWSQVKRVVWSFMGDVTRVWDKLGRDKYE